MAGPFDEAGMFDVDFLGPPAVDDHTLSQQQARPDIFVCKFGRGRSPKEGSAYWSDDRVEQQRLRRAITWHEFRSAYNVVRFANLNGLFLDTLVTVRLEELAKIEHGSRQPPHIKLSWERFKKNLNQWLSDTGLPNAHIGVIENGQRNGLHAHVLMFLGSFQDTNLNDAHDWKETAWYRKRMKKWLASYVTGYDGNSTENVFHLKQSNQIDILGQWFRFHYLMKGVDTREVIVQRQFRNDGMDLKLGDLVAYKSSPLGPIPDVLAPVWVSRNLDVAQQRRGVIPKVNYRGRELDFEDPQGFQSELDVGIYDVRRLFAADFVKSVMRDAYCPLGPF